MPKISVIIPCYNQEPYIAECIESVLAQTFTDYEIIVINDGSTDNSAQIVSKYMTNYPQIKLINQSNQGVIAARNNAISQAKGYYIYPLDGDDKIHPKCLETLYAAKDNADVISSEVELFGEKNERLQLRRPTKMNMIKSNQVVCSALYKKSDWEIYGGYDANMKNGLEDWEFWLNFIEDNKTFYRVGRVLLYYRCYATSRNNTISSKRKKELKQYIRSKHKKLYTLKMRLFLSLLKLCPKKWFKA